MMVSRDPERPGWGYYAAIALFVGVLAFAILGLVRSTSSAGASDARRGGPSDSAVTPTPGVALATGRIPTPQIPPPTRSDPTQPPSRTYLHPPPELAATAPPEPAAQPRR